MPEDYRTWQASGHALELFEHYYSDKLGSPNDEELLVKRYTRSLEDKNYEIPTLTEKSRLRKGSK